MDLLHFVLGFLLDPGSPLGTRSWWSLRGGRKPGSKVLLPARQLAWAARRRQWPSSAPGGRIPAYVDRACFVPTAHCPIGSPNRPAQHCRWPCAAQRKQTEHPWAGRGGAAVFFGDGGGWSLTYYPVGPVGLPLAPSDPPRARLSPPPWVAPGGAWERATKFGTKT